MRAPSHPALRALWLLLGLLGLATLPLHAQSLAILDAQLDAQRRPALQVQPAPGAYLILYRGSSVTEIRTPVATTFGGGATTVSVPLTDPQPVPATPASQRFYRVLSRPVTAPTDLDGDGIDDVYELGLPQALNPLDASDASQDFDGDGISNRDEYLQGTDPLTPNGGAVTTFDSSPDALESGVSVHRETILTFNRPLAQDLSVPREAFYAEASGRRLLTRTELSGDLRKLTLFYLEPMPGAARVRVFVDGNALRDSAGQTVDADRDGRPGGTAILEFDTFGNQPVANTAVVGQVLASELAEGPGGASVNRPLAGVTITVDGAEETLRTVTGPDGRFVLQPAPAGRFFVHIDGRTSPESTWPNGNYYPVVGKSWDAVPGRTNNPAGETGVVYLPLVRAGTLQTVQPDAVTPVAFPAEVIAANPSLEGVEIRVPPNALVADDGTRGGRVGIAPVAPDRIPSPLPPGLELPLVITIQTDGPQNFDQPVPVRFPNLPHPVTGRTLGPGEKSALWSFNHDTGRWEMVGPMTVSADGRFVETDPGVGVLQPGWHGTQPGVGAGGGPLGGDDPCNPSGPSAGAQNCRQNPDFTPDDPNNYNGCGPDGWDYLVPDNPNGLLFPCASFFSACKAHDIGYNTCGKPKQETDDQFLADMLAACQCLDGLKRSECTTLAVLYHRGVTSGGEGAFGDAQDKACVCEDPPPPPPDCENAGGSANSLAQGPGGREIARRLARHAPRLATQGNPNPRFIPQLGPHRFAIIDVATGQVTQRGPAGAAGVAFAELILAPQTTYDVAILQDATLREGRIRITTGPAGSRLQLPPILIKPPVSWDFDGDGLHDAGELIAGTNPNNPDSDGDGVGDGAEIRQGSNPIDGAPLNTGVVGSAPTPGRAIDIAAHGNLVVTANDEAGITLFDIAQPFSPTRLLTLDTPGRAIAVALSSRWIAVADGSAGVAAVNLADIATPSFRHTFNLGSFARSITLLGDIAYAGLDDGSIAVLDLLTGKLIERRNLDSGAVQDVFIHRDALLALSVGWLNVLPIDAGELLAASRIQSPGSVGAGGRRLRLYATDGVAFATHTSGFNVFDIADPALPRSVRVNNTPQAGWKQIVPNGTGLALATVDANSTDDGAHDVALYQVGTDGSTNRFLATFPTPGLASAVTLHHGIAYVADGRAGLQVVHYLAFDVGESPPEVSLQASFPLDPPLAEEGKLIGLSAAVFDDVQVRHVDFLVDGRSIESDGNAPFEARFITPPRSSSRSSFTIEARATDTGGNSASTGPITVQLVADATPPRVIRRFPNPGAVEGNIDSVSATFNEPIRPATLDSRTFRLRAAGPDGRLGTQDDPPPIPASIRWIGDRNTVVLQPDQPLEGGLYEARLSPPIADLAGIPIPSDIPWTFWIVGGADSDGDGIPDAIEAALGTDPNNPDSNRNGIPDGAEDHDRDGLRNAWELVHGLNPLVPDSDGNGTRDDLEDLDNDGLTNRTEQDRGLNGLSPDTDGDNWDDAGELASGSDPNLATSVPALLVVGTTASFLNAAPDTLPQGSPIATVSALASFLNAIPDSIPAATPITTFSPAASYLNATPDSPAPGTPIVSLSPIASFLNATPDTPAGPATAVSPVVSYDNR
jgi:hypothetical protein